MVSPILAHWIFWTAVVICAVAQIAIVRSTILARAAARESETVRRSGPVAEVLWVMLPALLLALVLLLSWRAVEARGNTASAQRAVLGTRPSATPHAARSTQHAPPRLSPQHRS